MADLSAFRGQVRNWLEENCPAAMRQPTRGEDDACWGGRNYQFQSEDQKLWLERMAAKGWTVPTWPKEYGGGGLSKDEAKILASEMRRIGARSPLTSFGIWMLGPALLEFGTHEQKLEHLPPIARGEIRWCQGYSEPGAGSDLASLRTRADDKGDHYIINGQKIWTSYADKADWIFCLVRTDFEAKQHEGISFILFDMAQAGVSTKPIKLISGSSPFCETFFDDARAEKRNLVGQAGKGWTIAKYLLTHERAMIGDVGEEEAVHAMAVNAFGLTDGGLLDNPVLRADVAKHEMDAEAFRLTMQRAVEEAKAGASLGAYSSMLKYYGTELNKDRHELIMKTLGHEGLEWSGQSSHDGAAVKAFLRTKANSIEGGTSEVMLNIVAKRILDLPSH